MSTNLKSKRTAAAAWCAVLFCAGLFAARGAASSELHLEVLKSGTSVYSNVTVISQTDTDIFIRHSQGFGNLKISALDRPTLRALGMAVDEEPQSDASGNMVAHAAAATLNVKSVADLRDTLEAKGLELSSTLRPTPALLAAVLAGMALAYLFYCYCLKLICVKAGSEPGLLIWLPVLQMFPLLRAAGMSGWWFVAFCLPVLNLIAHLLWCVRISNRRGKGLLTALFLILPGTNILAFFYLAFSGGNAESEDDFSRGKPEPLVGQHVFEGLSH
jgi:hypothetical protein